MIAGHGRQRHDNGNMQLAAQIARHFKLPDANDTNGGEHQDISFEHWIYLGQVSKLSNLYMSGQESCCSFDLQPLEVCAARIGRFLIMKRNMGPVMAHNAIDNVDRVLEGLDFVYMQMVSSSRRCRLSGSPCVYCPATLPPYGQSCETAFLLRR